LNSNFASAYFSSIGRGTDPGDLAIDLSASQLFATKISSVVRLDWDAGKCYEHNTGNNDKQLSLDWIGHKLWSPGDFGAVLKIDWGNDSGGVTFTDKDGYSATYFNLRGALNINAHDGGSWTFNDTLNVVGTTLNVEVSNLFELLPKEDITAAVNIGTALYPFEWVRFESQNITIRGNGLGELYLGELSSAFATIYVNGSEMEFVTVQVPDGEGGVDDREVWCKKLPEEEP